METANPRLRKRKAVEYIEDDDNDSVDEKTPKKKVKTVAKASKGKEKVTKTSKPKASTSSKPTKKTEGKETKTSRSKVTKAAVEKDVDTIDFNDDIDHIHNIWDEAEMLAQVEKIPLHVAKNLIGLLTEGCTLPFIARYRKTAVDNLMPDRLQELHESYENITHLKKKVKSVIDTLKKSKKLTPDIEKGVLNARNLSELDLIYAPLKSHSLSLAERARNLGLEPHAVRALNGEYIDMNSLCGTNEELSTVDKVESHITHIVADIIYKDTRVLENMRSLKEETRFTITSSRTKSSTKDKVDDKKKLDTRSDPDTYKLYFDWKCPSHFVKPHQTLALNRGEDEKILSVKVVIPDWFYNRLERFCLTLWQSNFWVHKGLGDAYNRLIKPWLSRHVRSDLTATAQKEAVKTFTTNLEKYLLTEPIKNRIIMGLDPGFRAGCKVGIINSNGDKLDACTIHPDLRQQKSFDPAAKQIKDMISQYSVELIGLGNGTACRETELWLKSNNICDKVPIIIVPEQGASIYSVSKEAQKEHPNMDPNLISALSIARRVLDPLGELIKVDPKNLGVGMYQHDIPPKMLETALDSAVEKVVSLVGVDINTASQAMLRRISGLNEGRAKKIIEYRQEHNGFESRAEILKVTGIGKITFQQCAGFLTVLGSSEPLDTTIIHPESYKIAKSFAKKIGVNIKDLTKPHFPQMVETKVLTIDVSETSAELKTDVCTLELIINAFKQKKYEDNVITFCKPVYSVAVQNVDQLKEGTTLTDWNIPGTSSEPTVFPSLTVPHEACPSSAPPPAKITKASLIKMCIENDKNAREYAREREKRYDMREQERLDWRREELRIKEMEIRERVRQRDAELFLQAQWQEIMKEGLNVLKKYLEKKND